MPGAARLRSLSRMESGHTRSPVVGECIGGDIRPSSHADVTRHREGRVRMAKHVSDVCWVEFRVEEHPACGDMPKVMRMPDARCSGLHRPPSGSRCTMPEAKELPSLR